ncbi:hypothetical protein V1517DRAFT_32235 [Lipomyces orientalis]|uniref:Uncharacterized protein n=1 Tax=Lipomyces orientalis TaxID=1233043 RepID=A0ACC3TFG4_9ASCO
MFAGTNIRSILKGKNINSPCSIFCTDNGTHELFDEFTIGVEHLNETYLLRNVVPHKAVGPFASRCQGGEELVLKTGLKAL